jgi:putative PIN family toxin of toxin-antitoxin system
MRVILDTNVIIASFAARGLCYSVFELCLDRFDIIMSPFLTKEIRNAFLRKIKLPETITLETLNFLSENTITFDVKEFPQAACRDPDDVQILALAEISGADYIITEDKDLLVLKKHGSTRIVSPRRFWELSKK